MLDVFEEEPFLDIIISLNLLPLYSLKEFFGTNQKDQLKYQN